jgi:hypothetical protein
MFPSINSIYNLTKQGKVLDPQELSQYYDIKVNNTIYHRLTNNGGKLVINLIEIVNNIPENHFALIKPILRTIEVDNIFKEPALILLPEGFIITKYTPIIFICDFIDDLGDNALSTLFDYKNLTIKDNIDLYSPTQYFTLISKD